MSDLIELDVAVIGGGVVGLAAAASSAAQGWSVALLERHGRLGLDTSTHNSGVIHAGMYYPAGSLKAGLCVRDDGCKPVSTVLAVEALNLVSPLQSGVDSPHQGRGSVVGIPHITV